MKRDRTRATVATGVGVQHGTGSVPWSSRGSRVGSSSLEHMRAPVPKMACATAAAVVVLWSGLLVQAVLMPLDCVATRDHKDGCGLCSLWGPCWH